MTFHAQQQRGWVLGTARPQPTRGSRPLNGAVPPEAETATSEAPGISGRRECAHYTPARSRVGRMQRRRLREVC
jgi:hypothetical protein